MLFSATCQSVSECMKCGILPRVNSSNSYMLNFFFELGMMKRNKHEGARLSGVENPESLADHTMRAAVIAYVLAHEEGADPLRCAMMLLIHDIPECRVSDQHKVAARYYDAREAEEKAFEDQIASFPEPMKKEWAQMFQEFNDRSTKEGTIAKDADWVELAIAAREYIDLGFVGMQDWLFNISQAVETETARKWMEEIQTANPNEWWQHLKQMTYTTKEDDVSTD